MIRRLNYTDRIKINRSDLMLATHDANGELSFEAALRLVGYDLPADALVFVEAYRQTQWMRFSFGTVANYQPPPPDKRILSEFDSLDDIHFRVKVTQAADEHILLAVADRIKLSLPDGNSDAESLLPVVPTDLGDELWRVELNDDEPRFLVNKFATPDCKQLARSPVFISLVYPAVLRQLLNHILVEGHRDTDDEFDWRSKWLRFGTLLPGVNPQLPDKEDEDGALRWADEVVAAFAKRLALKEKFSFAWQTKEGA